MISGGCLCGAVRFETEAKPLAVRSCWCRLCQYIGAGSNTVNVCFPTEGFLVSGEPSSFESDADSGTPMRRSFCGTCGTPLFSEAESRPHLIFVRAGALDDPSIAKPEVTIWTSAAPDWVRFDDDMPTHPTQPPPVKG